MKTFFWMAILSIAATAADRVRVDGGIVEAGSITDKGVRTFLGIPYAAPPVGPARWKAPAPVVKWNGVHVAKEFGSRCQQNPVFNDMIFRDKGASEDCLYLNVWTPAKSKSDKLPVMVWIYGGGFVGGASSEPRQDGSVLATKGVIVVSMNYRLGIFGFFSHPELTRESPHAASGNYGLLDQAKAIEWVHKNIKAFGGDPSKVTIFGESAGSFSVSAQMASPLARGLIAGAIGESGAFFGPTLGAKPLKDSEQAGVKFAQAQKADSLKALREMSAEQVLKAAKTAGDMNFGPNIDGYFFPKAPTAIYAAGEQAHIPLLAGWNSDEFPFPVAMAKVKMTADKFKQEAKQKYGVDAEKFLAAYPAGSDAEAYDSAKALSSDQFIVFGTWKWQQMQKKTGKPVYAYIFNRVRPSTPPSPFGAVHASEIDYVFGMLDANKGFKWQPDDYKTSEFMQNYWTNFAKTGNPNGTGLPEWPANTSTMWLQPDAHAAPEVHRDRYEFLDALYAK